MKQNWKLLRDLMDNSVTNALKATIAKVIDDNYSEFGIPADRVKFMKNKWWL